MGKSWLTIPIHLIAFKFWAKRSPKSYQKKWASIRYFGSDNSDEKFFVLYVHKYTLFYRIVLRLRVVTTLFSTSIPAIISNHLPSSSSSKRLSLKVKLQLLNYCWICSPCYRSNNSFRTSCQLLVKLGMFPKR